jgi:hypothetical protein
MANTDEEQRLSVFKEFHHLVSCLKTYIEDGDDKSSNSQLQLVQGYIALNRETLLWIAENELQGAFRYRTLSLVGRDCYIMINGDFTQILHNNRALYLKQNRITKLYEIVRNRNARFVRHGFKQQRHRRDNNDTTAATTASIAAAAVSHALTTEDTTETDELSEPTGSWADQ